MTSEELTTIGQAITIITCPAHNWGKSYKTEVVEKLLEIMKKYQPKE